ncbi:MAG: hypothetical protein K6U87_07555 [Firmicutes bacterium]|nr:hypothetical protein [Bacillota bacterium]
MGQDHFDPESFRRWFSDRGLPAPQQELHLSPEFRQRLRHRLDQLHPAPPPARRRRWWPWAAAVAAGLLVAWWGREELPAPPTSSAAPHAAPQSTFNGRVRLASPVQAALRPWGTIWYDNGFADREQQVAVSAPPGTVAGKQEAVMATQPPDIERQWLAAHRPSILQTPAGAYYFIAGASTAHPAVVYLSGAVRATSATAATLKASWFGRPLGGAVTPTASPCLRWPLTAPFTPLGRAELLLRDAPGDLAQVWVGAGCPPLAWNGHQYEFATGRGPVAVPKPPLPPAWYGSPLYGPAEVGKARPG